MPRDKIEVAAYELIANWSAGLARAEISGSGQLGLLFCDSCARVHGRTIEAALPLLFIAEDIYDPRNRLACRILENFERVWRHDGATLNDPNITDWTGTTIFTARVVLACIAWYSAHIPDRLNQSLSLRVESAIQYVRRELIPRHDLNTNYLAGAADLLAGAGVLRSDMRLLGESKALIRTCLKRLTSDGIFYGEGKPLYLTTASGVRSIDICYNLEETLPSLLRAIIIGGWGDEFRDEFERLLKAHHRFIVPDGGIDGSWGSRSYKWAYWGSRTAGCFISNAILLENRPAWLLDSAVRHGNLLKQTTHGGLLEGGLGYRNRESRVCIHHTISKATSLSLSFLVRSHSASPSALVKVGLEKDFAASLVPIDSGFENIQDAGVVVGRKLGWYASVGYSDWSYRESRPPTGGSLCLLWHERHGVIVAANQRAEARPEPYNCQIDLSANYVHTAPRIELVREGNRYSTAFNTKARFHSASEQSLELWTALAHETDASLVLSSFVVNYAILDETKFTISWTASGREQTAKLVVPVVGKEYDWISSNEIIVDRSMRVSVNGCRRVDVRGSVFSPMPGFSYVIMEGDVAKSDVSVAFSLQS